jgi:hypothetical protein
LGLGSCRGLCLESLELVPAIRPCSRMRTSNAVNELDGVTPYTTLFRMVLKRGLCQHGGGRVRRLARSPEGYEWTNSRAVWAFGRCRSRVYEFADGGVA